MILQELANAEIKRLEKDIIALKLTVPLNPFLGHFFIQNSIVKKELRIRQIQDELKHISDAKPAYISTDEAYF